MLEKLVHALILCESRMIDLLIIIRGYLYCTYFYTTQGHPQSAIITPITGSMCTQEYICTTQATC